MIKWITVRLTQQTQTELEDAYAHGFKVVGSAISLERGAIELQLTLWKANTSTQIFNKPQHGKGDHSR